jgi:hypothetical protein
VKLESGALARGLDGRVLAGASPGGRDRRTGTDGLRAAVVELGRLADGDGPELRITTFCRRCAWASLAPPFCMRVRERRPIRGRTSRLTEGRRISSRS